MDRKKRGERDKRKSNRFAGASLLSGLLVLLLCELPWLLAFLGLGAFSAAAGSLQPPPWLESIAIVLIFAGILWLGWRCFAGRIWQRAQNDGD